MILKGIFKVTNLFAKYLIISVLLQYPVSYIEICMLKPDNILISPTKQPYSQPVRNS